METMKIITPKMALNLKANNPAAVERRLAHRWPLVPDRAGLSRFTPNKSEILDLGPKLIYLEIKLFVKK